MFCGGEGDWAPTVAEGGGLFTGGDTALGLNAGGWMMAAEALKAVAGAVAAFVVAGYREDILKSQMRQAMNNFAHQENMAVKQKDAQIQETEHQERKMEIVEKARGRELDSKLELEKVRADEKVEETILKEGKKNEKLGHVNETLLNRTFDPRGTYPYGEPRSRH